MNELTIYNTTELTNKKLVKEINVLNKACEKDFSNKWLVADTIAKIVSSELYLEDFENEKNLAEYLGMKRSYLNRMKRASEYHKLGSYEVIEDGKTVIEYPLGNMTVNQIIELLPIPADSLFTIMSDYDIKTTDSCASIRESVQAWKEDSKALADKSSSTSSTSNSESSEEENIEGTTDEVMNAPIEDNTENDIIAITKKLNSSQKSELIENIVHILTSEQKATVLEIARNDF